MCRLKRLRIKGSDEFQRETESTDYYYYDEKDNDDDDISISFVCTLRSRHENSYKILLKYYYVKINSFLFNSHIYL